MHSPASEPEGGDELMTFGGHLEVLRRMLLRIVAVAAVLMVAIFCCKTTTWHLLLWPTRGDFPLYALLQSCINAAGMSLRVADFNVHMMSTELSSQFMLHVTTSLYLALVLASPYIVFELYRFVSPALYAGERRASVVVLAAVYVLFFVGLAVNYFIILPLSFRFLGTYQVDPSISINITLDSYISLFLSLSLIMGLVFQLPVVSWFLARWGILRADLLARYRRHALLAIVALSAIVTPPDLFSCVVVTVPLYLLYEVSIHIVRHTRPRR